MLVNELAYLLDLRFKDSKGTRVGDHDSAQLFAVLLALRLEIRHVQVAGRRITLDRHDTHTSHCGTRWVSAVRRNRNQTYVALLSRLLFLIFSDYAQSSELALSS
jgi:hypothetical protein